MIVPDKITTYKESIISKVPLVIEGLISCDKNPVALWEEIQNKFVDINEFILTIDVTFSLGTIEYLKDKQVIRYVKADNM
jgi:hypothetical protein